MPNSQKTTLHVKEDNSSSPSLHIQKEKKPPISEPPAKEGTSAIAAVEAENKKKKEEDERNKKNVDTALMGVQDPPGDKSVTVDKREDSDGDAIDEGKTTAKGEDPKKPNPLTPTTIDKSIWDINIDKLVSDYAHLRGKMRTKTEGMFDKKAQRAEQTLSAVLDPVSSIGRLVKKGIESLLDKQGKPKPLTEERIQQVATDVDNAKNQTTQVGNGNKANGVKQSIANTWSAMGNKFNELTSSALNAKDTKKSATQTPLVFSPLDSINSEKSATVSASNRQSFDEKNKTYETTEQPTSDTANNSSSLTNRRPNSPR